MMWSEDLTEGVWIPVTDGDWLAHLVGIVVRSVIEIRRRLLMSMVRSLSIKKSAPRIDSVM